MRKTPRIRTIHVIRASDILSDETIEYISDFGEVTFGDAPVTLIPMYAAREYVKRVIQNVQDGWLAYGDGDGLYKSPQEELKALTGWGKVWIDMES